MRRAAPTAAAVALAIGAVVSHAQSPAPMTTNSIGMELVLIDPGALLVGSYTPRCPPAAPAGSAPGGLAGAAARGGGLGAATLTPEEHQRCEQMATPDRRPGFTARIERPFYIGKYEVTQLQWTKVMGSNPSVFQGSRIKDDSGKHPVDSVTWGDAQRFIARLNAMEKTTAYRMPTEFEWEYAARAGSEEEIPWSQIGEYAWYFQFMGGGRGRGGASPGAAPPSGGPPAAPAAAAAAPPSPGPLPDKATTQMVGQKKPNAWGLYDMVGNVWEWVADWYNEKQFADPTPPRSGKVRVLKGASFSADQTGANYFVHAGGPADGFDVGFRIVKDVR